jgi:hypothetical protein
MRRRLRRQQRVREALLLDLGALVFELHRQGRREPELLQAKAAELTTVDEEVRSLAAVLQPGEETPQLVAPGIAGSCSSCGALLTTDARFCPSCGTATGAAPEAEPFEFAPELSVDEDETTEAEVPREEHEVVEAMPEEPEPQPEVEARQPSPEPEPPPVPAPPRPSRRDAHLFEELGRAADAAVRRGRQWIEERRPPR